VIITRKRAQSLERVLNEPCPYRAARASSSRARRFATDPDGSEESRPTERAPGAAAQNPDIARALREEESAVLRDLKQSLGRDVTVKADHQLHHEQFDVMAV
jgi:Ribonuclease G/E